MKVFSLTLFDQWVCCLAFVILWRLKSKQVGHSYGLKIGTFHFQRSSWQFFLEVLLRWPLTSLFQFFNFFSSQGWWHTAKSTACRHPTHHAPQPLTRVQYLSSVKKKKGVTVWWHKTHLGLHSFCNNWMTVTHSCFGSYVRCSLRRCL